MADASAYPGFLSYDSSTSTWTLTTASYAGSWTIEVQASVDAGVTWDTGSTFVLTVDPKNWAPTVTAIPDQTVAGFSSGTYTVVYTDTDVLDSHVVTVDKNGGGSLPVWITVSGDVITFAPPDNSDVGTHPVEITVTDDNSSGGASVLATIVTFDVIVTAGVLTNYAPVVTAIVD
jgi:hypothetical protein